MSSARFTITPPSNPAPSSYWVDLDVSGSALAGVQPDTPVSINPLDKSVNILFFGLTVAFVSAANQVSVGVKGIAQPFDVLLGIP